MKKVLVGAAIGTAGLVALTGATFAQTEGDSSANGIRERVAEILGIAPEDLQEAFEQAREEQREERLAERLANAVEEGIITQEEADAITTWLDAMPESLDDFAGYGKHGNLGHFVGAVSSEERIAALVERLVAAGKITEDEAEGVTAWLEAAPVEVLAKLGQGNDGHPHRRGFHGRMFGHGPGGRLFEGRFHIRPYTPSDEADETGTESSNSNAAVAFGQTA